MFKKRKFEEDYELLDMITQSPNSKMYRVIHRRTAKEYVAKVVYKPDYVDWVKSEADCLNQIHQAHDAGFIKLHDAYETPSKMFILIFEPIKGKDLVEFIVTDKTGEKKADKVINQRIDILTRSELKISINNLSFSITEATL